MSTVTANERWVVVTSLGDDALHERQRAYLLREKVRLCAHMPGLLPPSQRDLMVASNKQRMLMVRARCAPTLTPAQDVGAHLAVDAHRDRVCEDVEEDLLPLFEMIRGNLGRRLPDTPQGRHPPPLAP